MKIGIISDTHGYLDPTILKHFSACDEIWHAGDIGPNSVLEELEAFKPFVAVYGNIDDHAIRAATKEDELIVRNGKKVLITHIAGNPPRYNPRIRTLIYRHQPDLLVCGHSHILKVSPDRNNRLLFMNPGAAGKHGFHKMRTVLRMDIKDGTFQNLEVIELGKRGVI